VTEWRTAVSLAGPVRLATFAQGGAQFAAEGHPAPLPSDSSAKRPGLPRGAHFPRTA